MKLIRSLAMLTILASGSLAAAEAPKAPKAEKAEKAPPPEVSAADTKAWLAFFDKFVDAVVADKDNCDKLATDVGALLDANASTIATAHEHKAAGHTLPKSAQDHMQGGVKKMAPVMQKCMANAKVKTVFERFAGMGPKPKSAK